MCTAISFHSGDTYFGRNLDLYGGYGESVVVMPRSFAFPMRCVEMPEHHYAMVGMATVVEGVPLFYEATNEKGVSAAALNFPGNAFYESFCKGKENVAAFELIPWLLGQSETLSDVKNLLSNLNLVRVDFSETLPLSPLHFMISDKRESLVIESTKDGLFVYDNPFEVLTNNPPFQFHLLNMSRYMSLTVGPAVTRFRELLPLENYSFGMGAMGLPGDFSSPSRFVRAVFVKENLLTACDEASCVNQFFHILSSVSMPKGCVLTEKGYEYTRYSSCCNADKGFYYYVTYENPTPIKIELFSHDLDGNDLFVYPALVKTNG